MIDSRNPADLDPRVRQMCEEFVVRTRQAGLTVIITSTLRDHEMQAALYARGRTLPGPRVTNARPGSSYHQYGLAFDFVPAVGGKPLWKNAESFRRCGEIGEAIGLEWAGRWRRFREAAHLQWTGGLTIRDLLAGRRP
ncbi:MAG: M15 family metallopeptidase [Steroidobacteraceae bacterium]